MAAFSFHWIDLLVVAVVLASAAYATWRGFVAETLSIIAWAAAAFATLYFGPSAAPLLKGSMSPVAAQMVAYVGVFLVVVIPASFVAARFAENVRGSPVGPLDRSLGAVFGIVRGLIVLAMALIVFTLVVPVNRQPGWITDAMSYPVVQDTGDVLLSIVPNRDVHDALSQPQSETASIAPQSDAGMLQPRPKPGEPEAAKSHAKKSRKSYGAQEREALDRLIQSTGDGGGNKP